MTKLKVFPFNVGGTINGIEKRIEDHGNELLSNHPDLKIEHTAVVPTSSGLSLLLVFYSEVEKLKEKNK